MNNNITVIGKGTILYIHGIWYTVVTASDDGYIYCICDHANNRFAYKLDDAEFVLTAYEAMRLYKWYAVPEYYYDTYNEEEFEERRDRLNDIISERPIPTSVIAEVLAGCHDHRFDDWIKQ